MYVGQGIPWGFMTVALISYLTQRGVGDADAGKLTGIVLLPWTFKLIWAPLIDTLTVRSMGRRRAWIIGAELMMAVSLLGLLSLGDLTQDLRMLGWMFFLHNCFASLQDVSTDALAVDILPRQEQGRTNGLMWGSKLIGKAIGASGMAMVIDSWGLSSAILLQFLVLLLIMLFPLLMVERHGEKRLPWTMGKAMGLEQSAGVRSLTEVTSDLRRAFRLFATSSLAFFGAINLIGWGIVEVITKTLYTQQLGWRFVEYSNVAGVAVVPEMVGALLGGFIADRFGRRKVMAIGFGGYGVMAMAFGICPHLWHERWFTAGYLFLNPGILAMGSVGYLSMSMRISWTRSAASVFTIYMTLSNVGHVLGNWMVGSLREHCSYEQSFVAAGIFMLLPLTLLALVRPESVDRLRDKTIGGKSESDHP